MSLSMALVSLPLNWVIEMPLVPPGGSNPL